MLNRVLYQTTRIFVERTFSPNGRYISALTRTVQGLMGLYRCGQLLNTLKTARVLSRPVAPGPRRPPFLVTDGIWLRRYVSERARRNVGERRKGGWGKRVIMVKLNIFHRRAGGGLAEVTFPAPSPSPSSAHTRGCIFYRTFSARVNQSP